MEKETVSFKVLFGGVDSKAVDVFVNQVKRWYNNFQKNLQTINFNPTEMNALKAARDSKGLDFAKLEKEYLVGLTMKGPVLHIRAIEEENISAVEGIIRGALDEQSVTQVVGVSAEKLLTLKRLKLLNFPGVSRVVII